MDDSFSAALKEARKTRGWTQEDLAKQLGVKQQSVQKWEAGKSLPRPQRRDALMRALNIDSRRINEDHYRRDLERSDMFRAEEHRSTIYHAPEIQTLPRLSGQVRESAFMAAVEQALPPELHEYLEPPRTTGFRFAADYISPRVAADFTRMQGLPLPINIVRKLWGLSTLQKIDEQASNKPRHYVLILIGDDLRRAFTEAARWTFDATIHGIHVEVGENAEAAAEIILDYEKGIRPMQRPDYDYDDTSVEPPPA